jgi:outer membrane usher protein
VWVVLTVIMTAEAQSQTAVQRVLLPVEVNATARGEMFAYVDGDDVLVPESLFVDLGVAADPAAVREIENERFISLKALAPKVTFTFDPENIALSVVLSPDLLGERTLELQRRSVVADQGGDPSLFFNYALAGERSSTPGIFTEIGASKGHRFAYTGVSRNTQGELVRGLSYLNVESPRSLRRLTFGDAIVGSDALGGSVVLGGVTMSRQFSLQPYLIRTPALNLTGAATTPSVVEVYVNGQLTNRVQVQPGVFTLQNLPATGGLGNTRLVIRDAFGRETVVDRSFYYSTFALRKGLSDYTFSIGSVRNNLQDSFEYENIAGLAYYRKGVTDRVTVGGRAEASEDVVSGGPSLTLATRFGDFDTQLAASSSDGRTGTAGTLTYRFSAPLYSFGVAALQRSDEYATLSLPVDLDRPVRDITLFAARNFRGLNFGLTASRNELRDGQTFDRVAVQANATLGRWGNLFSSFGQTRRDGITEPEILVGLTFGLGRWTTGNVQYQDAEGRSQVLYQVRRPLGFSNGYGYTLQSDTMTEQQLASLQYQTSFGRYELNVDAKNADAATYNVAGGVVMIGGTIKPTRSVEDGFALARVGVPGVQVFAMNQPIGRTDRSGDLLISNLLPHYENELRISDKDIPIDYEIIGTQVQVVPPTRGGVIATFPVRRLQSYTGRASFMIVGQPYTPGLGEIIVETPNGRSLLPLGRTGEFYAENLDPGSYKARLRIGKVQCGFTLVLPDSKEPVTDIGVVSCAP